MCSWASLLGLCAGSMQGNVAKANGSVENQPKISPRRGTRGTRCCEGAPRRHGHSRTLRRAGRFGLRRPRTPRRSAGRHHDTRRYRHHQARLRCVRDMDLAPTRSHSRTHASNMIRGFSETQVILSILGQAPGGGTRLPVAIGRSRIRDPWPRASRCHRDTSTESISWNPSSVAMTVRGQARNRGHLGG